MHQPSRCSGIYRATRRGLICVLARAALPGQAKRRLAPVLGADWAAELGRAFLADTWRTATRVTCARAVLVQTERGHGDPAPRLVPEADLRWQLDGAGGELGTQIEALIERALLEAPWVIVLATDTPALSLHLLELSASALAQGAHSVIGPNEHGGWYLLGMRRPLPGLGAGMTSASSSRAAELIERLQAAGMQPLVLDPVYEVEQPADLVRLRAELRAGVVKASATARALRRSVAR